MINILILKSFKIEKIIRVLERVSKKKKIKFWFPKIEFS